MIYTIGRNVFKNQKEVQKYYREILKKIEYCEDMKSNYKEYYLDFVALFERHPDNKAKDMLNIKIDLDKDKRNIVPYILIEDEWQTISWIKCITGRSENKLKEAMRTSIKEQIDNFRKENDSNICEICYKKNEKINVDHIIHFEKLYNDFIENKKNLPEKFEKTYNNRSCFLEEDKEFETEWKEYHKRNGILRITCEKCNLSREKYKR